MQDNSREDIWLAIAEERPRYLLNEADGEDPEEEWQKFSDPGQLCWHLASVPKYLQTLANIHDSQSDERADTIVEYLHVLIQIEAFRRDDRKMLLQVTLQVESSLRYWPLDGR